MISPETTMIAFVGTGVMGGSMAKHLLDAGYQVTVYNRTKERAEEVIEKGALWAPTVAAAVDDADVVITIVGYPDDVEEVYLGEAGVLENAKDGAYLIDMTTSSPQLAKDIFAIAEASDLHALDAPVSGGDLGARNATLTIMVGGSEEDFNEVAPILNVLGKKIVFQGGAGFGQHAKMANQVAIAGSMLAVAETLSYAKAVGLDPEKVLESVTSGSGTSWSLENLAPRALHGDFDPGFFVKHFIKDMNIALDAADRAELTLPGLETAKQLYDMLSAIGGDEMGTQAICLLYADEATCASFGLDWENLDLDEEGHEHSCGPDCDHDAPGSSFLDSPFLNEN